MGEHREKIIALPSRFYRDPVDCVDELRAMYAAAARQAERDRIHKGRRIRVLVKQQMKGVGR